MKKQELIRKTETVVNETHDALQFVYDSLNQGQKKKILSVPGVIELFERYDVQYE